MISRYRVWFTRLWLPRVGPRAADLNYRAARLDIAGLAILASVAISLIIARTVHQAVPFFVALPVFVVGVPLTGYRAIYLRKKAARVAAAEFLPFDCDPRDIPIRDAAKFDKWQARILKNAAANPYDEASRPDPHRKKR